MKPPEDPSIKNVAAMLVNMANLRGNVHVTHDWLRAASRRLYPPVGGSTVAELAQYIAELEALKSEAQGRLEELIIGTFRIDEIINGKMFQTVDGEGSDAPCDHQTPEPAAGVE